MNVKIYHNRRCSKSREALKLLKEKGLNPDIREYLKVPLSKSELKEILSLLGLAPKQITRCKEKDFKELKINLEDDEAVIAALANHPKLIERPIVVVDQKAVLGRPPENILELFN